MARSKCGIATDAQGRELARHGNAAFPVACYCDDLTAKPVPWHWHDELEAIAVMEGAAIVSAGAERYTVRSGNGILINAGTLHAVWSASADACTLHSLVFHPRLVGGSIDSVYWQNYLQPLMADTSLCGAYFDRGIGWQRESIDAIEAAWRAFDAESAIGYEFTVRELLSRIIYLLMSQRPAVHGHTSEKALRDGERIKLMLQYIQDHYSEAMNTVQIAKSALVSGSECLRCFHSTIGITPIQYVKQYRVQRAAELLATTAQSVADIAAQCGFQELSYFAKTFRELRGATPSEYRRSQATNPAQLIGPT